MCPTIPDQQVSEAMRWIASLVIPALAGLGGVVIGAWLTARRERAQRSLAFREKQLIDFYSPMLGLRNEVQTESAFRVRVQAAASAAWAKICADSNELEVTERQRITRERSPEFTKIIEYDNSKLHEKLLPAYRKMVELFRENYYLAEPETQGHYQALVEFVEGWNRWIEKALPPEVLQSLGHGEDNLAPFYVHLEAKHAELRGKLERGQV